MSLATVTLSHSPLMHVVDPASGARERVEAAFADARAFVAAFDPELTVVFAPDHYNGFFYDMMPPFCIGHAATAIGDYGTPEGPVLVDRDAAAALTAGVLGADLDVAQSERMYVDHGFAQPLQVLFGGIDRMPVVPVFVNCVAEPLGPVRRARLLGAAIGAAAARLGRRVLVIGSGGLSHDPPMPRLDGAPPEVARQLISEGRHLTPQQRVERERRVIAAGERYAAGDLTMQPLNPEWDRALLATLREGDLAALDAWTTESFTAQAGHSSHEARTSIAAYAAQATQGPYRVTGSFYEPIPDWIAGFAVTTVETVPEAVTASKEQPS